MLDGQLKNGTKLNSLNGKTYTIKKFLASGGQGEVYVVDSIDGEKALKWYYKTSITDTQKTIIMNLVHDGSPSELFLWPEDVVTRDNEFGYVMQLRPKEYKNIPDLFNNKVRPNFETLFKIVLNMAKGYETLHQRGYSYKDISDKNLFFRPDTGDILICDNDNVSGNGNNDSDIDGTMDFMAPEIVRGEAYPSKNTDLHSLAVLIFEMLFISHPLDGQNEYNIHALDENARRALYGKRPVFIYDPNNSENRPVPGWHDNAIIFWKIYPEFLKEKFIKAFTTGLKNPNDRVVEREWKDISIKSLNSIVKCSCGAEVFIEEGATSAVCWNSRCGRTVTAPPCVEIGKHRIFITPNTTIKAHHIYNNYDINTVVATVTQNPKNPSQYGLRNDTAETWTYVKTDGTQVMLPPGRSAAIVSGATIDFGNVKCKI